jgi:hypothetical protein
MGGSGRLARASVGGLAVCSAVLLTAAGGSSARVRVTAGDRAATHAYLEAQLAYLQARLAVAPAGVAAAEAVARRVEGECPGVLAGAPRPDVGAALEEEPATHQTARQRGEANRQRRQLGDLGAELGFAIGAPLTELERHAAAVFDTTVGALRWSSAAVTAYEHALATRLETSSLAVAPAAVCADMRAWVQSGYRTLSASTKGVAHQFASLTGSLLGAFAAARTVDVRNVLLASEGPAERALAARVAGAQLQLRPSRKSLLTAEGTAEQALGVTSRAEAEEREQPRKGSVEVGHGRTAAGASYTIWVEPRKTGAHSLTARCSINLGIEEHESASTAQGERSSSFGSSTACLSRSRPEPPTATCVYGEFRVEAQTPARASRGRLRLSDGREITSPVAQVPSSLGGPAGFYYQVLREGSASPVSLTELDAAGKVLRVLKLPHQGRCKQPEREEAPKETRTIARGPIPNGASFTIVGERQGGEYSETSFTANVRPEDEGLERLSGGGIIAVGQGGASGGHPFARQTREGCTPSEYAIVFGVLSAPRDTVLVRSGGILRPLHRAPIPPILHVKGVLAYIALPGVPTEVIVRDASGKTVSRERMSLQAREAKETCEGEAEG